jgi:Domain of unknown function (DUF4279)
MSDQSGQNPKVVPFHYGASLYIKGDGLNFDEISRTLGLVPYTISEKGKRYGHAQTLCDYDAWYYSSRIGKEQPLDKHIMALWDVVHPHIEYLRDLKQKFEISVSIYIHGSSLWFGKEYLTCFDFEVDHRGMKLFTELGIPCKINVTIQERAKEK